MERGMRVHYRSHPEIVGTVTYASKGENEVRWDSGDKPVDGYNDEELIPVNEETPAGITSFDPMPYGYVRWNGAVWVDIQVDRYNAELARIQSRHNAGMDTQALIDGLYNLAHGFDHAGVTP